MNGGNECWAITPGNWLSTHQGESRLLGLLGRSFFHLHKPPRAALAISACLMVNMRVEAVDPLPLSAQGRNRQLAASTL